MKYVVFWEVAPCRSCVNRRFGRTFRLYFHGRKIRERGTSVATVVDAQKVNNYFNLAIFQGAIVDNAHVSDRRKCQIMSTV
jgi:hypothetical protein